MWFIYKYLDLILRQVPNFKKSLDVRLNFLRWADTEYYPHLYCFYCNVSVVVPFCLLQVYIEPSNLHEVSKGNLYLIDSGTMVSTNPNPNPAFKTRTTLQITSASAGGDKKITTVCLPYLKGLLAEIQKICCPYNTRAIFRNNFNRQRNLCRLKPNK